MFFLIYSPILLFTYKNKINSWETSIQIFLLLHSFFTQSSLKEKKKSSWETFFSQKWFFYLSHSFLFFKMAQNNNINITVHTGEMRPTGHSIFFGVEIWYVVIIFCAWSHVIWILKISCIIFLFLFLQIFTFYWMNFCLVVGLEAEKARGSNT